MKTADQEIPSAPIGRRLIVGALFGLTCVIVATSVGAFVAWGSLKSQAGHGVWVLAFGPLFVGLLLAVFFEHERSAVARFRIESDCLVLARKRYPLAGLVRVERDPAVMRWALRLFGNGGLGAIRGRFWSRRIGRFEAFLTNTEQAVVLRWPDRVVAVSPADPENFIVCAKAAASLR